jgi:hypothetical protein
MMLCYEWELAIKLLQCLAPPHYMEVWVIVQIMVKSMHMLHVAGLASGLERMEQHAHPKLQLLSCVLHKWPVHSAVSFGQILDLFLMGWLRAQKRRLCRCIMSLVLRQHAQYPHSYLNRLRTLSRWIHVLVTTWRHSMITAYAIDLARNNQSKQYCLLFYTVTSCRLWLSPQTMCGYQSTQVQQIFPAYVWQVQRSSNLTKYSPVKWISVCISDMFFPGTTLSLDLW